MRKERKRLIQETAKEKSEWSKEWKKMKIRKMYRFSYHYNNFYNLFNTLGRKEKESNHVISAKPTMYPVKGSINGKKSVNSKLIFHLHKFHVPKISLKI